MDHRIVQDDKVDFTANPGRIQTGRPDSARLVRGRPDRPRVLLPGRQGLPGQGQGRHPEPRLLLLVGSQGDGRRRPRRRLRPRRRSSKASTASGSPASRTTRRSAAARWRSPGPTSTRPPRCAGPTASSTPSCPPRPTGDRSAKPSKRTPSGILVQIPAAGREVRRRAPPAGRPGRPEDHHRRRLRRPSSRPSPGPKERQELVNEYYAPFQANDAYPPVMLSNEELDQVSFANTDINTLVKEKFASWIVNGTHRRRMGRLRLPAEDAGRRQNRRGLPAGVRPVPAGRRVARERAGVLTCAHPPVRRTPEPTRPPDQPQERS